MKKLISLLSILLLSYSTIFAQSNNDGSFALKKENGHYYFETQINDKVPAKMMLESGIFVMVMDSIYAFENKEAINLDYVRTQGNEKMNLGRKVYDITHKDVLINCLKSINITATHLDFTCPTKSYMPDLSRKC